MGLKRAAANQVQAADVNGITGCAIRTAADGGEATANTRLYSAILDAKENKSSG